MGKVKKLSKKFGQKVSAPGALDEQILKEKYAKPTSRVKGRNLRQDGPSKKVRNIVIVLPIQYLCDYC